MTRANVYQKSLYLCTYLYCSQTQSKGQQTDNTAEADAIFKAFNVATFRPEIEILFER